MGRSFDLVDDKLFEGDFFLDRLAESGHDWFASRCYFSAFVSAARTVTFALQGCISDVEGFGEWYAEKQAAMRANTTARFLGKVRTESQHLGINPLNGVSSSRGADGESRRARRGEAVPLRHRGREERHRRTLR
jgi:hypothetical protein